MALRYVLAVLLACGAALAQAQPQKVHRVGILAPVSLADAEARANYSVFTNRLRELGYVEGSTLALEWRFADGKYERLPLLAGELVKANVDVIVAGGTPAVSAARRATATIPIVAASFGDPVMSGFAQSLARPGGNVTGFTTMGSAIYEKRLELIIEAVPGAKRIGLLVNPDNAFHARIFPGLQAAAEKRGRDVVLINASREQDILEGMAGLAARRVGGVIVGDDTFLTSKSGLIASLALRYKLPTVVSTLRGVEDGGMIAYMSDLAYRYRSAAEYVDRILKGAKAGELPIEQPVKLDMVVNARTAKALGIAIPQPLLLRASRVIE